MQPLQICIGPSIRIGRESWCLPYAGFLGWDMTMACLSGKDHGKISLNHSKSGNS